MKFNLPIDALPEDERKRYQILQDYFCDQRGNSFREDNHWVIETYWPPKPDYFVDPNILKGFTWWDLLLTPETVHQQVRKMRGFQLSLNDSWTLFSWSEWLADKIARSNVFPEEIIILHVDYHNDLMTPRIAYSEGMYTDLISGEVFDIKKPNTVKKSILNGAIGVGSFIIPFVHEFKKIHFRHLCDGQLNLKMGDVTHLQKSWESDTLLSIGKKRPTVIFERNEIVPRENFIDYRITDSVEKWITELPNVPILLHIDMDYFNCRYDGDSDWEKEIPRYDPNLSLQLNKMDDIFSVLRNPNLKDNIENIAIALSPGFYPVEFWEPGISKMSRLITSLRE